MLDEKDQQRMEREIRAAFAGVARAGGVSWTEAGVIDGHGTEEECAAARAHDTDRSREQLVDDPAWDPDASWGGYSFLDAIGFRYYLAPAMIRAVRTGEAPRISHDLTLPGQGDGGYKWRLDKWARLDARQRSCIASFLVHMAAWPDQRGWEVDRDCWREALTSYWDTQKP